MPQTTTATFQYPISLQIPSPAAGAAAPPQIIALPTGSLTMPSGINGLPLHLALNTANAYTTSSQPLQFVTVQMPLGQSGYTMAASIDSPAIFPSGRFV